MGGRQVAFRTLVRVDREEAYASLLLDALLERSALPERERALATELTYGVLRWRGRLDRVIAGASDRPLRDLSPELLNALRLGAYQLLFLTRIPAYAAVDETVKLVGRPGGKGVRALANAILRRIQRDGKTLLERKPDEDILSYLAALYSHPEWLLERWLSRFGEEAFLLLRANNEIPPLSVGTNLLKTKPEELEKELKQMAEQVEQSSWVPGFFRIRGGGSLLQGRALREGFLVPMDEAAALPVYLLDPRPGEVILDACAGGGGKTALIAGAQRDKGKILALDQSERALRRLKEACRRLGIHSAEPILGDARMAVQVVASPVDRILVDAPCTGLGTLRRHPEIKWRLHPGDFSRLQRLQLEILEGVAPCLKPGGILIYSTCTTEPEENEGVVEEFSRMHPEFTLEDPSPCLPGGSKTLVEDGYLRTYPHRHGTDAFFAVRFRGVSAMRR